jgi:hypothetical protein
VKKKRRRRRFCAFNKSEKKEENYCDIRHLCTKKLAKKVYMYILSQHYHFDRQWKELERPNTSFQGRTTYPIIRSIDKNNTAAHEQERKKILLFNISFLFFCFWYGRRFLTHYIIAKTHTHTQLTTIRKKKSYSRINHRREKKKSAHVLSIEETRKMIERKKKEAMRYV